MHKSKGKERVISAVVAKDAFVPLKTRKKFLWTRREAYRRAKKILKDGHYGFKFLSLEDGNKVSFFSNDYTFKELMGLYLAFDGINDVDDLIIEADDTNWGFWIIVCFQRPTFPNSDKPKDIPHRWSL